MHGGARRVMADVRDGSAFRIPVGRHSSCRRGGAFAGPGSDREPARRGVRGRGPAAQRRLLRSGVGRTPTQTARPRRPIAPRRLDRPRVGQAEALSGSTERRRPDDAALPQPIEIAVETANDFHKISSAAHTEHLGKPCLFPHMRGEPPQLSPTIARFCSTVHDRRRSALVRTSTRGLRALLLPIVCAPAAS